jgi:hypothetical protein
VTLPAGENQVQLGLGAYGALEGPASDLPLLLDGVGYARGLTDRFQLRLPLVAAYQLTRPGRQDEAAGLQLAVETGLYGAGFSPGSRLEDFEDPRQPRRFADGFTVDPGVGLLGRLPLGSAWTLFGRVETVVFWDFFALQSARYHGNLSLVVSPVDVVSVGFFGETSLDQDLRAADGLSPEVRAGAMVWLHVDGQLDLTARPTLTWLGNYPFSLDAREDALHVGGLVGFDWHFQ